ncbi:MAG: 3-methyl-2-oxobutanoate hydroxymethyltransferase [Gammaproteobacteria bacterium]|nr:3-methyl-2-oxobutanoate hydroxymethyltransferase [Gammaproteobacteria bacterium]
MNIHHFKQMKQQGEKISCLTAYDASFARVLSENGVEVLLVGDTLGMVIQGQATTLPVRVEDMIYHAQAVRRGAPDAFIIVDLPFASDLSLELALTNAASILKQSGAQMVKLEGGERRLETIRQLTTNGIPVCGHLGLTPQSVHKLGGYKVQGRESDQAQTLLQEAKAIEQAGADLLVLECVPRGLGADISGALSIPTIGIGAGPECDGQVLVLQDMLGISPGPGAKFNKVFLQNNSIAEAISSFVQAVKNGTYPANEHCYN